MTNEALPDEEVAARVRATVAGDFQSEQVNGIPMKPDQGYYDLVRFSSHCRLPPMFGHVVSFLSFLRRVLVSSGGDQRSVFEASMKEDDVEHEKRRASAEKHKSMEDTEKKKERKNNLEREALKECRAKSRHEGEPKEDSPDEDDDGDNDDDDEDYEGMVARLDRALQDLP